MQTLGTTGAAVSIVGAALVGLVSVPVAAVVGLGGVGVAVVSLLKKLSDDRAVAKLTGMSEVEGVLAR